jgi:hypothetical protein
VSLLLSAKSVTVSQSNSTFCVMMSARVFALLLTRLQALSQRQAIEDFLAAGNSLLNLQASSSEEIGRAGQEARRLVAQLGDVSQVCWGSSDVSLHKCLEVL